MAGLGQTVDAGEGALGDDALQRHGRGNRRTLIPAG
jgi:hypothetical protein